MKCLARCKYEPRGDQNLEGYQCGNTYHAELIKEEVKMLDGVLKRNYWRVWPTADPSYYETCSTRTFDKYFSVENPEIGT